MGKRSKKKQTEQKLKRRQLGQGLVSSTMLPPVSQPALLNEPAKPKSGKPFFKTVHAVISDIVLVLAFLSIIFLPKQLKDTFSSTKEKFENEKFVKGIFIPVPLDYNSDIVIQYGSSKDSYPVVDLQFGVALNPHGFNPAPWNLKLKLEHNRLFISAEFKDIETRQIVGTINYNNWNIVKRNVVDYESTDRSITVKDNEGNTIFYLYYFNANKLILQGYYITEKSIIVISKSMWNFPWVLKDRAVEEIQKIPVDIQQ